MKYIAYLTNDGKTLVCSESDEPSVVTWLEENGYTPSECDREVIKDFVLIETETRVRWSEPK